MNTLKDSPANICANFDDNDSMLLDIILKYFGRMYFWIQDCIIVVYVNFFSMYPILCISSIKNYSMLMLFLIGGCRTNGHKLRKNFIYYYFLFSFSFSLLCFININDKSFY